MNMDFVLIALAAIKMAYCGEYEEYQGCGVAYYVKTKYKNGLENGRYEGYEEGYLIVEGNVVNDKLDGEWISTNMDK